MAVDSPAVGQGPCKARLTPRPWNVGALVTSLLQMRKLRLGGGPCPADQRVTPGCVVGVSIALLGVFMPSVLVVMSAGVDEGPAVSRCCTRVASRSESPEHHSLQLSLGLGPPHWVESSEGGGWGFQILKITMWVHCSLTMRPPWGRGWWRTVSERQAWGLDHCRGVGVSEHLAVCRSALWLCTHTRAPPCPLGCAAVRGAQWLCLGLCV